jgi:hypothetical protein
MFCFPNQNANQNTLEICKRILYVTMVNEPAVRKKHASYVHGVYSQCRKIFEEPMLVLKQTIPQKKLYYSAFI